MTEPRTDGAANAAPKTVVIRPEQEAHLQYAFDILKMLSSPARLAILGALAARPGEALTRDDLATTIGTARAQRALQGGYARVAGEPARSVSAARLQLDRDLNQLIAAGLVEVVEWEAETPGHEPQPGRVTLAPAYVQTVPQSIAVLHQITSQLMPPGTPPRRDDRAQTLARFLKDGRLVSWPTQFKQQTYIAAEIVKVFAPDRTYTEREVDAILKEIYAYDHCTLRRTLIDLRLMERENGIYRKTAPAAVEASA